MIRGWRSRERCRRRPGHQQSTKSQRLEYQGRHQMPYLRHAVEAEPNAGSQALLLFGVPLAGKQSKSWNTESATIAHCGAHSLLTRRHSGFKETEEETDSHSAAEVLDGCKKSQDGAPHDDIEGRIFPQGEILEETVGRPLPGKVAEVEPKLVSMQARRMWLLRSALHGPQPAVLIRRDANAALRLGFFQPHDGSVANARLIQEVQAVHYAEKLMEMSAP